MTPSEKSAFLQNQKAIKENIEACENGLNAALKYNLTDMALLINLTLFQSIFNHDLSLVRYNLVSLEPGWGKTMQARLAALLIVEFMEDISQMLGKDFRSSIDDILDIPEDQEQFKVLCKNLSMFRSNNDKRLRTIRNISIGHRDKDAKVQLEAIRGIDVDEIVTLCDEVTDWLTALINFLTHVTRIRTSQA